MWMFHLTSSDRSAGWRRARDDGGKECTHVYRWDEHPPHEPDQVRYASRTVKMTVASVAIFSSLLLLGFAFPIENEKRAALRRPLRFAKDGTFQISIFEDLHFGESKLSAGTVSDMLTLRRLMGSMGPPARSLDQLCHQSGARRRIAAVGRAQWRSDHWREHIPGKQHEVPR